MGNTSKGMANTLTNKKEKRKGAGDSAGPGVGLSRQPLISDRQHAFDLLCFPSSLIPLHS